MYRSVEVLCTICARGGSKGVKGKNMRPLCGTPLVAYSIRRAIQTEMFDHVVVSTDSDEIAAIAVEAGGEVFFRRDPALANDYAPKIVAIRDAFLRSETHFGKRYDINVDLDATSPLRLASDIRGAVDLLIDGSFDTVVSGTPSRRSPYFNILERGSDGRVHLSKVPSKPVVRRQDAPECFDQNASIYVWKRNTLLEKDSDIVDNTGLYVMPEERSIDIDSEVDFRLVELLMTEALRRAEA